MKALNIARLLLFLLALVILTVGCSTRDPDLRDAWVGTWTGEASVLSTYPDCYKNDIENVDSVTGVADFRVVIKASATTPNQVLFYFSAMDLPRGTYHQNIQTTGVVGTGQSEMILDNPPDYYNTWTFTNPSYIDANKKFILIGDVVQMASHPLCTLESDSVRTHFVATLIKSR